MSSMKPPRRGTQQAGSRPQIRAELGRREGRNVRHGRARRGRSRLRRRLSTRGMLTVKELGELFEAVTTLSAGIQVKGDRLMVVTNGGGAGVLAADALEEQDGRLATLSTETLAKLDSLLPRTWSRGNPIDVLGRRVARALPRRGRGTSRRARDGRNTGHELSDGRRRQSRGRNPDCRIATRRAERARAHSLARRDRRPSRASALRGEQDSHVRDAGRCGHRLHVSPRLRNQELLLELRAHMRARTRPTAKSRRSWSRRCLPSVGRC